MIGGVRAALRLPRWVSRPPLWLIAAALAVLLAADHLYRTVTGDGVVPAFYDETAHLMTGYLVLVALFRGAGPAFSAGLLGASVLIDADHIPGALGYAFFTNGTPRPYTHSLLTIALVVAVALLWRRRRALLLGVAVGLTFHFARDMAERPYAGVALGWPLSDHGYTYGHVVYLVSIAALAVIAAARSRLREPLGQLRPQLGHLPLELGDARLKLHARR
jgi:inner membrane protein